MRAVAAETLHPYLSVTVESISVSEAVEWEVELPETQTLRKIRVFTVASHSSWFGTFGIKVSNFISKTFYWE